MKGLGSTASDSSGSHWKSKASLHCLPSTIVHVSIDNPGKGGLTAPTQLSPLPLPQSRGDHNGAPAPQVGRVCPHYLDL